ncbi:branched-chain amino acid ABC transporter permease [Kibdelosporangium philippinense]|uniref:Branched-chain amino acid ABC transporter permease n=1 Tax=Kibdelosporangium philippinense TaxID=211113 RepID=A0ABS8Z687_9PSEU|nr:branched-chain amino acid ABC transporter permease [Kibdelosporangium philippinense]MCE7002290.1 branched-chain amino acid ABC transporter permease [Kibdelosporangium philippinense]
MTLLLRSRWTGYAAFLVVLLLVPAIFTRVPFYTMSVAVLMGLQAITALGLVPLTGHGRLISLGQAAFYGIGGYTSALLTTRVGLAPALGVLAGVVLAAGVAWLLGRLLFRVQGHYLALATLSFGLMLGFLFAQLPLTGATSGITSVPSMSLFGFQFTSDVDTYYLVAAVLLIAVVLVDTLLRSPVGRALTAVGDSPVAAAASGVSISALRRGTFALAAALAALGGGLYVHWTSYADPSMLGLLNSVQLLVVAVVGGLRTVWGAPLGALVVLSLSEATKTLLPHLIPGASGNYEIVVYGAVLVLVVLFLPNGVAGLIRNRSK